MKISQEENELLLELVREASVKPIDPQKHVTTVTYAEAMGISKRAAYDHLEKLRHAGILKREKVRGDNQHVVYGYYK
jgi:predicted transcriptional regulator